MNSRNLFGTVICAILVLATSSAAALGQNDPAAYRLLTGNGEDSPPSFSETMADQSPCAGCCDVGCCQSCCCPRWTASADFIILDRIGGANQTLVERVPLDRRSVQHPWHRGAQQQRFSTRLLRRTEGRLDSPRR